MTDRLKKPGDSRVGFYWMCAAAVVLFGTIAYLYASRLWAWVIG